jgi:hypothetical protein
MRVIAVAVAGAVVALLAPSRPIKAELSGPVTDSGGNIPVGIWRLNRERSSQLAPADQILWIIKDDGAQLIWVMVSTEEQGNIRVHSWQGAYDGDPVRVEGSGIVSRISSSSPGTLQSRGTIEGMGSYSEDCTVMSEDRRFVCRGQVTSSDGAVHRWVDDFDWVSESPR